MTSLGKTSLEHRARTHASPPYVEGAAKGAGKELKREFKNGMEIVNVAMGKPDGKQAKPGKRITMKYVGKLQTGKIFDQTRGNATFQFRLAVGEVIKVRGGCRESQPTCSLVTPDRAHASHASLHTRTHFTLGHNCRYVCLTCLVGVAAPSRLPQLYCSHHVTFPVPSSLLSRCHLGFASAFRQVVLPMTLRRSEVRVTKARASSLECSRSVW